MMALVVPQPSLVSWATSRTSLADASRFAFTQVGVLRTTKDARVAQVGDFRDQPTDLNTAWHDPTLLALVAEVWSPPSDKKECNSHWYAERGIPQYWLAEPIEGEPRDAMIIMYELAHTLSGSTEYVERRRVTLAELERDGLN